MRADSLQFFEDIVNVPSPSGFEEGAAELYRNYCSQFADELITDTHGNVAAIVNPNASMKIMLAGHMDEIGFMVHHVDEQGMLYFSPIGGHDSGIPVGQRVWVHTATGPIAGVVGSKAIHLMEPDERKKKLELHELWIDIGAKDREDAKKWVNIGDSITYQVEFQPLLNDRIAARGFDNKMGSFIVAEALRHLVEDGGLGKDVGVYAVATVQEEIGLRGARTSAFWIDAQCGLAVDVNHATDTPRIATSRYGELKTGEGPSIARGANINPVVFRMLIEAADKEKLPYQVDAAPGGTGTDANAMQITRGGMAVGLVGVPLRYMHTPGEILEIDDVANCAKLMAGFCRLVTPDADFQPRMLGSVATSTYPAVKAKKSADPKKGKTAKKTTRTK